MHTIGISCSLKPIDETTGHIYPRGMFTNLGNGDSWKFLYSKINKIKKNKEKVVTIDITPAGSNQLEYMKKILYLYQSEFLQKCATSIDNDLERAGRYADQFFIVHNKAHFCQYIDTEKILNCMEVIYLLHEHPMRHCAVGVLTRSSWRSTHFNNAVRTSWQYRGRVLIILRSMDNREIRWIANKSLEYHVTGLRNRGYSYQQIWAQQNRRSC